MAEPQAPLGVQVEAEMSAWNERRLPWPEFVAAVRDAVKQFPNPVYEERPTESTHLPYKDADGTPIQDAFGNPLLVHVTGRILIGNLNGTASLTA